MWLPQSAPLLVDLLLRAAQSATTRQNHPPVSTHTNCSPGLELPGIRELTHPSETSFVPSPPLQLSLLAVQVVLFILQAMIAVDWGMGMRLAFWTHHCLVSCPDPPCTCKKEGLVFWATFPVKWGRVAPQAESSNQIAECVIICDDVGNLARDLALQTEGKLLSQLICYVLGHSKVGRSLLEFCKACLAQSATCKL